ncbi:efflux RND transporter periplasmic adaptor subunit [Desulfovibrio sp. OttesenSCG-928-C06]|nr:efflux RND transporter periplasmic adaptor subunit [Desulfovibrio sp. OttesenSCG-928-C06]
MKQTTHSTRKPLVLLALLLLPLLALAGCSGDDGQGGKRGRVIPVRTVQVQTQDVQQTLAVVGHVEASATVEMASQVSGQLMQSLVEPGHNVRKGQLLFRLDKRTFEAAVAKARAAVARDEAELRRARQDVSRYKSLAAKNFLSQQQYELSLTEVAALEATINQDKAALESALVELGYTEITAPISGRVGEILVDPGNIIKANDKVLLVINTISPAEVRFAVPEKYLPELLRRMREGDVEVRVRPEGDRGEPVSGKLTVIDNAVDRDTGTVAMRAWFENADERLWPGQFLRVSIVMEAVPQALVLPFRAILEGMGGQYVYVVKDGEVSARPVKTVLLDKNSIQIVEGLEAGEEVVTDGQLNLFPGAKVEVLKQQAAT